ncbi:TVP38/TMEM64 family protein [Natronospora cellulosivora (SeqCode)]
MSIEKNYYIKRIVLSIILVFIILLFSYHLGIIDYIGIGSFNMLNNFIESFGILAPIIYIIIYVLAAVFFFPAFPLIILAAVLFDPIFAIIYASIGSTLGAIVAFLVGRYFMRGMVEKWMEKNERIRKIDIGVKEYGWRMLILTRTLPVFPYNIQNYAYGLTNINLLTFSIFSWLFKLPTIIAYILAAASIVRGEGDITLTFIYLGIAVVLFVLVSLIPKWLKRKKELS